METYYDRDIKSQADVNKKYGENGGVRHLPDGSKVGNGQYTVYNNDNGILIDNNGNQVSNDRTIIYGDNYTLFAGTTDQSVNAETLHGNLFGSSYIGPNNPKDYTGKKDNHDYQPTWSPTDMAARKHDMSYDVLGAKGVLGALKYGTRCADRELIYDSKMVLSNPNSSNQERNRARAMGTTFSIINFFKR